MESVALDLERCYQALLARDSRFDGVFFVGVETTGIYCRPVCPARTPRQDNCRFFRSAADAERHGLRPCLRCRPELAPGNARIDSVGRLAAAAAAAIEDGALTEESVDELAARLGVTARHLRRAVEREFGVSPIALAQTQRLLTAKRLLTDTRLTVTEVAFASGFSSLRRFNALFRERYRMNPTDLRRRAGAPAQTLVCEVGYRPPMDWESLTAFLGTRAVPEVEAVVDGRYVRTAGIGSAWGWVSVQPSGRKHTLRVELSDTLAPKMVAVLARVKRVCDVAAHPEQIASQLGTLAQDHPGLRLPGAFDGFELAVRAVLGQQVSVRAATTLAGRFAAAFGEPLETPFPCLSRLTPTAERVAQASPEEIAALGIVRTRACTILHVARAVADGRLTLTPQADTASTMDSLRSIPGVGQWTAQYVAMRALGWPDAFPASDLGVLKALCTDEPRCAAQIAEQWRPWRAYAVMHLWKSLEERG